jgi:hypothetical protein
MESISAEGRQDLRELLQGWCEKHGQKGGDLAELEALAETVSRMAGQAVMEQGLPAREAKAGYHGSSVACGCGRKAKFMGYRSRDVGTLFGAVPAWRGYYHCRHCHTGIAPWDHQQGLSGLMWTPGVKRVLAEAAGRLPYGEATALIEQFSGLRLDVSTAERIMAEVGGRLRQEEEQGIAGIDCGEIHPLVSPAPPRLYVSMDGTSAHLDGSWREIKLGAVYEGRPNAEGIDEAFHSRYVAACEPAGEFGPRLYAAAALAGAEVAAQLTVLGDGAEWIWRLAEHYFPYATHIVDYFHACEHIHDLAKCCYGEGNAQGQRWARDHCCWLKERGPGTLRGALKRMKPATAEGREAFARELRYFTNHRERMDYPKYRRMGLMIGSGPVEAGCKTVVGARLKQSGMRWSMAGADHVLAVRTRLLSGQHEQITAAARAA